MSEWEGWSSDQARVDQTCVLARLLTSITIDGWTTETPQAVIDDLGLITINADTFTAALDFEHHLVHQGYVNGGGRGSQQVKFNEAGKRLVDEFARATERRARARPVRQALLLWRYHLDAEWPHVRDMLSAPHAWFYGSKFSIEDVAGATDNLLERSYLAATAKTMGRVGRRVQLTSDGVACVEDFRGDPDAMEQGRRPRQNITIGSYNQQGGNTAFGSTVGTQTATTTITTGQTATDLIALLHAIHDLGGIPRQAQDEADQVTADLQAAADGTAEPDQAIGRAKAFFHALRQFAQPATQAVLTAAGNYAAVRMGMPHN